MKYTVSASAKHQGDANFSVKENKMSFGISPEQDNLANPLELLLGSFAACCLKNVERFASIMGFSYEEARIEVEGQRQIKPTKLVAIEYVIHLQSNDPKLNVELLHKNLQNHGTIYNTLKEIIPIKGQILLRDF